MAASARARLLGDLRHELQALDAASQRRRLHSLDAIHGPLVELDGRTLVSWCSNDYLGLSTHPSLIAAATDAAQRWGIGARASRLLAGTTIWHTRLEHALAAWFSAEAALVYPSGYLANLGTLGALLASGDLVFVDRLAHASLIDAARASRATLRAFRHNDLDHLDQLLSRAGSARRRFIVTEGVFSMDGDRAPLAGLADLAEAHGATVYLDDAHGTFVLGRRGRGSAEAAGVALERFLYMGTLGKALGCQGGFVVGPHTLIEFLHNRARTFLYTTALAVPIAAAATEALALLARQPQRRHMLADRAARLHARLAEVIGLATPVASHILPIVVGQSADALALAEVLMRQEMWAPAIRPPTVPRGTARIRLSVTAAHTEEHIDRFAEVLRAALQQVSIP